MNCFCCCILYHNLSCCDLTILLRHTFKCLVTHTHPFNGPFLGLPAWAGTRNVKPIWILLKRETVSGSGISWAICKSASRSRQITMPVPHHSIFLQAGCPSCRPTNSVKALKAKSRYQKGKTNLDFTEARGSEWQWHQLGHMQVCTLLQTDNHASTSPLRFLRPNKGVFYRPDALPAAQPTASKHWRWLLVAQILEKSFFPSTRALKYSTLKLTSCLISDQYHSSTWIMLTEFVGNWRLWYCCLFDRYSY